MRRRWKMKTLSIYPKLFISFLLVIVPIYGVSLLMNQSGKQFVEDKLSEALQSQIHFYLSSLETEISRLIVLKAEYVHDDDFQRLGTAFDLMRDYERIQAILSVKNKLFLLGSSTPFVENVKVFFPPLSRSVNANDLSNNIPEEEVQALLEPANQKSAIFSYKGRLMMSELYPKTAYNNHLPIMALEIEFSESRLKSTLSEIVKHEQGGAALLNSSQQWSVAAGNTDGVLQEFVRLDGERKEAGTPFAGKTYVNVQGRSYFIAYEYSKVLDATLAVDIPIEQMLSPLTKYRDWLWLLSVTSLVLIAIFSYGIFLLIHKPLRNLVGAFRKVEKGELGIAVHYRHSDEFRYLYRQFNLMVERLRILIQEVYEQQIRSQLAELKQLQAQINPHFLYNSFFILKGLVRRGEDGLSLKMLDNLGEYFKFITRSGSEQVPLETEVRHAVSYLEIQNLRFSGAIDVVWDELPEAWRCVPVPRLILQPLVENAYQHGLEEKVHEGRLEIRFRTVDNQLSVLIDDNGEQLRDEQIERLSQQLRQAGDVKETTGILNVHRRLQLTFGPEFGLMVARSELGGLQVRMVIPYRKDE